MAEELDDGEFWLPSQFLTDDDILSDFSPSSKPSSVTGSTETDSDDFDDFLSGFTRPSKGWNLSTSPQSTLCGFPGKEGSSRGSPTNGPVSPPPATDENNNNNGGADTWDLLNKAAGEVARMKVRNETPPPPPPPQPAPACNGTGFFDCSNSKGLLCPPPPRPVPTTANNNGGSNYPPHVYLQPQLNLHLQQLRQQLMMKQQQLNRITRSNSNNNNLNRPLGLPPSAWPPLQAQSQPITAAAPPMFVGQPNGAKRESVGTGVFLPRRVNSPVESRKKSDANQTKMRSGKGSLSQNRRNSRPPTTANQCEIQLPQEWTY